MATIHTQHSQLSQSTHQVLKELRAGRGVIVPKFGSFTFSAPNVNLNGVTNPKQRDFQRRIPVFIISPNFYQGGNLKPGAFCKEFGHIRPYDNKGVSGNMHLAKCNFTEVGILAGLNKDTARIAVERILKDLASKVRSSGRAEMALPGVGVINIWDGVAAVAFDDALVSQTIQSTNKNYTTVARKELAQSYLTTGTMEKFYLNEQGYDTDKYEGRYMGVNPDAKEFLEKRLNISTNNFRIGDSFRPLSAAVNYDTLSVSYNKSKRMMSTRPKARDPFANNGNYRSSSVLTGLGDHDGRPSTAAAGGFSGNGFSAIQSPLSIRYGELIKPTAQKLSEIRVKSIVKKRIGVWMREHSLLPIDAFFKILSKELGENVSRNTKVDRDLFARCLLLLDIGIDEKSAQSYGADLADKEGKIDAEVFIVNITSEDKDDLNHIRDIIHLNGLKFEDILKTMDIPREQAELDMFKISKGINRMDPKMAKNKADQIAQKILNGREVITTYDLVEALEGISKADIQQDIESNANVLRKIRIKLVDSENPNMLREEFEKVDEKNNGSIDSANFKTCLLKMRKSLDLTIGEINRIARYEAKSKTGHIDYNKFLESLDQEIITLTLKDANAYNEDSLFSLKQLKDMLKDYLARHKLTPLKFLAGLQPNSSNANFSDQELKLQRLEIPLEVFKAFLTEKVIKAKGVRPETINYYIHKVDIDRDGIVDGQDLEAFLTKAHLIEDTKLRMVTTVRDVTGEDYQHKVLKDHNLDRFFPVAPLPKSRIDSVLRALRTAIANRNLSFREFFTKLDENKDGMISYDEFTAGIKSVIEFSKETIKGLFAFMDRNQIGLIDFNNFLKVMKKSVLDNLEEKAEDNFEWQIYIIKQIQQWYFQSNLTSEDAFRMVDIDYDQCINKNDLRVFLKSILFIPIEEITSVRLDRLFNLMDQYKKGTIGYEDFRRILTENFTPTDNVSLTGGVSLNKHSFDWKLNARQKMGLYISKKYKDLEQSFEQISNHGARVTFEQFSHWIFSHSVLDGFNLTEKLLRDLFSDFDPHKKGHLTKADWRSVFAPYNHYAIKLHEITDIISSQFSSVKDAFQYFCSYGPSNQTIYEPGFHEALENLFPKRFTDNDKKAIWNMTNFHGAIGKLHFQKLFNSTEFNGSLSLTGKTTRPQTVAANSYTSKFAAIEPEKSDVISVLRDYLKCTPKQLEQVFDEIDITKCGKVTNLEFKDAIRKLNTGLSALEIDDLINATPMGNDGKINYKDFIKRMKESTADVRIQDRTRQRLHAIKDQIYIYLLTPKDAFRQFNSDRTGKLNFEDFQAMIRQLCNYTGEPVPPFSVLKDLFSYFDKRKDGFIDQREWLETFRRIEVPIKSEFLKHVVLNPNGAVMSNYEQSEHFDRVITSLNKNRKYIIDQLSQLEKSRGKVEFRLVKRFLEGFLRSQKIEVDARVWKLLIGFAERDDNLVDYRYMLDRYRERTTNMQTYPILHKTQSLRGFA